MKRLMQFTAAMAMVVALSACDRGPDANSKATGTGGTVGTSGSLDADREFVSEQLALGTAEIELGRLAQQRGTHPEVKQFAALMVQAHQQAAEELKPIAAQVNTSGQAGRADDADDHQEDLEELSKLTGRDFDRKYIEEMIDDHQEAIKDLQDKAENAENPAVKAWAANTLPSMRQHLARAESIKDTLDRAGTN